MTKGDDYRATASHCRFAAVTSSNRHTADTLREMASEYDAKAVKADERDAMLRREPKTKPE